MSNKKIYTSSIPEVREKQVERAKDAIREQLPVIVECLLEDDVLLAQLAEALNSVEVTKEVKTKK